ncbi:uncharacterized protein FIESC28_08726 [Fusarium coffeatum]|uniref:Rhodopsin domain-containing protein n=1 Tax=Fusarium coffeatum TaxID=231269 RepID=A0A366R7D2_9HYPO|nr:uncharacterized protein FIESC28_08726 [Fusarium coffeatum]RBR12240.1 hypothetical protein FIESC28_08726 [Fusarium coffeatum]
MLLMSNPMATNQSIDEMCKSEEFSRTIQNCISKVCTIRESLEFNDFVSTVCDVPEEDYRPLYRAIIIAWAAISTVAVVLLVLSKIFVTTPWGIDDTFSIFTYCIIVPCTVFFLRTIDAGFGSLKTLYQSNDLTGVFKNVFIWQVLFMGGICVVKMSILFFYLRIFPGQVFRRMVYATMAVNAVSSIVIIVCNLTVGRTVEVVWGGKSDLSVTMETYGQALKITMAHCVINFVVDVWMLILPMTQLYNLGLRLDKKIRVMCMFGIGIFLTAVSLVRLVMTAKILPNLSETDSNTHSSVIWANIELNVGFVVAVVAPIRQLFQLIFNGFKQPDSPNNSTQKSSRSRTAVFVDRSMIRIKDGDEEELVISDPGNLGGTTLASSSSRGTGKREGHEQDLELSSLSIMSNGKGQ